jgi:hypothetical protein
MKRYSITYCDVSKTEFRSSDFFPVFFPEQTLFFLFSTMAQYLFESCINSVGPYCTKMHERINSKVVVVDVGVHSKALNKLVDVVPTSMDDDDDNDDDDNDDDVDVDGGGPVPN